jgi:transposase
MGRPYSEDLRARVVASVAAGASCREAAKQFAMSPSCVVKLLQRWRRTGSVAPGQMGGWKTAVLAGHAERVRSLVKERPDLTLDELRDALVEHGVAVSRTAVWRFLRARELTLKKRRSTPPSSRAPTSRRRARRGAPANPS